MLTALVWRGRSKRERRTSRVFDGLVTAMMPCLCGDTRPCSCVRVGVLASYSRACVRGYLVSGRDLCLCVSLMFERCLERKEEAVKQRASLYVILRLQLVLIAPACMSASRSYLFVVSMPR